MKSFAYTLVIAFSTVTSAQQPSLPISATDVSTPRRTNSLPSYSIVERGPNHRVFQSVQWTTNQLGKPSATVNSYTELEVGAHIQNAAGAWVESSTQFQFLPDGGAAATNLPHQLYAPGS